MKKFTYAGIPGRQALNGSILIYVLWLTALLGLFTLSVGATVRQRLKVLERFEVRRLLRLAAESGVARAQWVVNQPKDLKKQFDALDQPWSGDEDSFKEIAVGRARVSVIKSSATDDAEHSKNKSLNPYGLVDEESKINLNLQKDSRIFKRLFILAAKLSPEDASILADSLLDWIDEDDSVNADGAENQYYQSLKRPIQPKNGELDALEEILYIRGMTPSIFKSIQPYVTLYGDGKVNINTASGVVLQALGLEESLVSRILLYRNGLDKTPGTPDDGVFESTDISAWGTDLSSQFSAEEKQFWESWLSKTPVKVTSTYFSVRSVADLARENQRLVVQCVIGRALGIQGWKETFIQNGNR